VPMTFFIPSVIFAKRRGMKLVSICLGILMVTMWALFAVHLPMTAIFSDSCVWMNKCEVDPETELSWTKTQAAIALSCLSNNSMVESLNLTIPLDYLTTLSFPTMANISSYFNFSTLHSFNSTLSELSLEDYNFNQGKLDGELAALSVLCGTTFTEENIETFAPVGSLSEQFQENQLYAGILTLIALKQAILDQISMMREEMDAIFPIAATLLADSIKFQNDLALIEALIAPIIVSGQNFAQLAYCGEIGDDYEVFKSTWCATLSTALAFLTLAMFLIAVSCVALIIASIIEETRISHPRLQADGDIPGRLSVDVARWSVDVGHGRFSAKGSQGSRPALHQPRRNSHLGVPRLEHPWDEKISSEEQQLEQQIQDLKIKEVNLSPSSPSSPSEVQQQNVEMMVT